MPAIGIVAGVVEPQQISAGSAIIAVTEKEPTVEGIVAVSEGGGQKRLDIRDPRPVAQQQIGSAAEAQRRSLSHPQSGKIEFVQRVSTIGTIDPIAQAKALNTVVPIAAFNDVRATVAKQPVVPSAADQGIGGIQADEGVVACGTSHVKLLEVIDISIENISV